MDSSRESNFDAYTKCKNSSSLMLPIKSYEPEKNFGGKEFSMKGELDFSALLKSDQKLNKKKTFKQFLKVSSTESKDQH